jgi:aspartate aminotransferase-like enzyme
MNPVLTAAWVPEGIPSSRMVNFLADEYQIKISTGLGALKERLIRVGHMSPVVEEADIDHVLDALKAFHASK